MWYRGAHVWSGYALSWDVAGDLGVTRFYFCLWSPGAFHLLQFCSYAGEDYFSRTAYDFVGAYCFGGRCTLLAGYLCLWQGPGTEGEGICRGKKERKHQREQSCKGA